MRPNKIWKHLPVDRKDQRCHSVWVGQTDFSKIAQRKQKFIKHVSCVYCLEKPFINVYTRIYPCCVASCATLKQPPKNLSVPIFLGPLDRPKNKIRSSVTPPPPLVLLTD